MGNTVPAFCRSVGDRSDLKNSRFDPRSKKNKNASGSSFGSSGSSKRGQVQPLGAQIATVNTSFLNHTKSNVKNGRSTADNFLEELDCNFCKDTILNGAIAGKIANDTLEVEERAKSTNTPISLESTRCKPPMTPLRSTISPFASTPFAFTQHSSAASTEMNDQEEQTTITTTTSISNNVHRVVPAIVHPETVYSFHNTSIDNESEIIYNSVSTIPIASDKDSDTSDEDEGNEEETVVTMIENEPLNKAKSSSLDEGINLKLKRTAYRLEAEQQKIHENQKCNFCDFVKNGTGRSWSDLDKDVSMLMDTVEKLSSMIAEKELSEKHLGHEHSPGKVPYSIRDLRKQFGQVGSLDESEEIVEEKKVSLSFLEKLSGLDDLKEKVQQLRNKRRIGISLMKTSHGKRLMAFSDGQNTYQILGKWSLYFYFMRFEPVLPQTSSVAR